MPVADRIPLDPVSAAILVLGSLFGTTWRITMRGSADVNPFHDRGKGRIYAFWHSHLLVMSYYYRNTGKTALVSSSRDGKRAAALAQRWGHAVIHGSSTRGGTAALRLCTATLREGGNVVITPDGPRGPAEVVKPGVAQISMLAGAPVVGLHAHPKHVWRLKSWDRFMIPKPFSRIEVRVEDPVLPPPRGGDALESLRQQIQASLSGNL